MKKQNSINSIANKLIIDKTEKNFKVLYDRLKPGIRNSIYKYVKDSDSRELILSKTFEKMWLKIDQYNPKWAFSTWAYTIARNEALQFLNKSKGTYSLDELLGNEIKLNKIQLTLSEENDFEYLDESAEGVFSKIYDSTVEVMKSLPLKYSSIIIAREVDRKKYKDISRDFNINLSTIKTRIRTARKLVLEEMENKYPELIESYHENF